MFWSVGEVEMDPLTHSLHTKSTAEPPFPDPLRTGAEGGEGALGLGLSLHGADEEFFGTAQRGQHPQATQARVGPLEGGEGRGG